MHQTPVNLRLVTLGIQSTWKAICRQFQTAGLTVTAPAQPPLTPAPSADPAAAQASRAFLPLPPALPAPPAGCLPAELCSGDHTHSWELLEKEPLPPLRRETGTTQSFKRQSLRPKVHAHPNPCPVSKLLTASPCNVLQWKINGPGRGEDKLTEQIAHPDTACHHGASIPHGPFSLVQC